MLYFANQSAPPADGISIPSSYTSFLAPITTAKLHADVTVNGATVDNKSAEQPYVVSFSAAHILSAAGGRLGVEKVQECWGFEHPRPDVVVDMGGWCLCLVKFAHSLMRVLSSLRRPTIDKSSQRPISSSYFPYPTSGSVSRIRRLFRGRPLRRRWAVDTS